MSEPLEEPRPGRAASATRKDLQYGRRLVHMANGTAIAGTYSFFFTHEQVIHIFGTIACLAYVADRIRIHYPEWIERAGGINEALFRAEEQFKESAMIPYAIAILLTMLTFPKPIALIAIYTLAIADPASALVGIAFGRRSIVQGKTIEGSIAFFVATVACAATVLYAWAQVSPPRLAAASVTIAAAATIIEMLPVRLDDNLTIPLIAGFVAWIVCAALSIPI